MQVIAFGIIKEIFGNRTIETDSKPGTSVQSLKASLEKRYPKLRQLGSYMIAVNSEYAADNDVLEASDEVAVIPPVSGG